MVRPVPGWEVLARHRARDRRPEQQRRVAIRLDHRRAVAVRIYLGLGEGDHRARVEPVGEHLNHLPQDRRTVRRLPEPRRTPPIRRRITVVIRQDRCGEHVARRHAQQPHAELDDHVRRDAAPAREHRVGQRLPRARGIGVEHHALVDRDLAILDRHHPRLAAADREHVEQVIACMARPAPLAFRVATVEQQHDVADARFLKRAPLPLRDPPIVADQRDARHSPLTESITARYCPATAWSE